MKWCILYILFCSTLYSAELLEKCKKRYLELNTQMEAMCEFLYSFYKEGEGPLSRSDLITLKNKLEDVQEIKRENRNVLREFDVYATLLGCKNTTDKEKKIIQDIIDSYDDVKRKNSQLGTNLLHISTYLISRYKIVTIFESERGVYSEKDS